MPFGECDISDMLLGRAKAWQGFCMLASRLSEVKVSSGGRGGGRGKEAYPRQGSGCRQESFKKTEKNVKTTLLRCMSLN